LTFRPYRFAQRKLLLLCLLLLASIACPPPSSYAEEGAGAVVLSPSTIQLGYSPVEITASATNGASFDSVMDAKIFQGGAQVNTTAISDVQVRSASELAFSLGSGLNAGVYQIRLMKEGAGEPVIYWAELAVVEPSVTLTPSGIPVGYAAAVNMTVLGNYTNFTPGNTTVSVLDAEGKPTGKAGTPSIERADKLVFPVNTGLAAGSYQVRVVTQGHESVAAPLIVRSPSIASLSQVSATEGYNSPIAVNVLGADTTFSSASIVSLLNDQDQVAAQGQDVIALNETMLKFNVPVGLAAGMYTIRITTGIEAVGAIFEVLSPSISLSEDGKAFTQLVSGYSEARTIRITGTHYTFSGATTITLKRGAADLSGSVSGVAAADDTLTFDLGTGLAAGTYTIAVSTNGAAASADFDVVDAQSVSTLDGGRLTAGYTGPVTVVITGTNTSFQSGKVTVSIQDAESAMTIVSVASSRVNVNEEAQTVTIPLDAGLAAGRYRVCAATPGNATTCSTGAFTVVDKFTLTADVGLYLGTIDSGLNRVIRDRLDRDAVDAAVRTLTVVLKKDAADAGTAYTYSDGIWLDQSGRLAALDGDKRLTAKLSMQDVDSDIAIVEIHGNGRLVREIDVGEGMESAVELIAGDMDGNGEIASDDYSRWLDLYRQARSGSIDPADKVLADLTMDGVVDNLDFSLWLLSSKL